MSIRYGQKVAPLVSRKSSFFKKNRFDGSFIKKPKASVWTRPTDWLNMPTITSSEQKIALLMPVFPQGSNFLAFTITLASGQYTVDWGDGNVEDVNSTVKAQHAYDYASLSSTVTSDGYKMAIVTIIPKSGQNLTSVNFNVLYAIAGSTFPSTSPILEIKLSCPNLTSLGLNFCKSLVNFSGINMGLITSYASLFSNLSALKQVSDLYTTVTVTNTSAMFINCRALLSVPLFNTASVTTMGSMFQSCSSITNVPFFNTSNVLDMSNMFLGCSALISVPLFNTASVTTMSGMFLFCLSLTSVPLFNTALVITMHQMFQNCAALIAVPLFNTSNVTLMYNMFNGCALLTNIPFFDTSKVTRMDGMFGGCRRITSAPLFNTASATDMSNMFQSCSSLVSVPLFNTASVTNMTAMFNDCTMLTTVPLFDMSKITSMNSMFSGCTSLTAVPPFITPLLTNISGAFQSCVSLISVPLFNTASVTTMAAMFNQCAALTTVPPLVSSSVTVSNFASMFTNCISLTQGALSRTRFTISYDSCKLSQSELESIFTNLGTIGAVGQTLTISNNWGAPSVVSLAATTVATSTTITMASTTGLAVGMQVTGTNSPLTTARGLSFSAGSVVTATNHGLSNGDEVSFATIVTTTGITTNTIYYVVNAASDTFQVAATSGGVALTLTGTGSGTRRHRTEIVSITPNTSIVVSRPMATGGATTLTFRQLKTGTALLKGWAVTG
jgi:surface protein